MIALWFAMAVADSLERIPAGVLADVVFGVVLLMLAALGAAVVLLEEERRGVVGVPAAGRRGGPGRVGRGGDAAGGLRGRAEEVRRAGA